MSILSNVHQSTKDAVILICVGFGVHYSRKDMGPLSRGGRTPSETDIENVLAELVEEGYLVKETDGTHSITYTGLQKQCKLVLQEKNPNHQ